MSVTVADPGGAVRRPGPSPREAQPPRASASESADDLGEHVEDAGPGPSSIDETATLPG
jgi:hypothetical protein